MNHSYHSICASLVFAAFITMTAAGQVPTAEPAAVGMDAQRLDLVTPDGSSFNAPTVIVSWNPKKSP